MPPLEVRGAPGRISVLTLTLLVGILGWITPHSGADASPVTTRTVTLAADRTTHTSSGAPGQSFAGSPTALSLIHI